MSTATLPDAQVAPSPLFTVQQVAAALQCSVRTVWALADAGTLPGLVKIGRLARWRRADVLAWIEAGCPQPKGV
jgi:excisionase family DNA binding protein